MKLNFKIENLQKLIDYAATGGGDPKALYGDPSTAKRGLWLVGDHGVYLMPNNIPAGSGKPSELGLICYAEECNPTKGDFDSWWEVKQRTFGGDDGVEFLDLAGFTRMIDAITKAGQLSRFTGFSFSFRGNSFTMQAELTPLPNAKAPAKVAPKAKRKGAA